MDPKRPPAPTRDTSPTAERMQVAIWRSMSTVERADLVAGASEAVRTLAMTGLRARHPALSDEALVPLYAALTHGRELARRAYPDLGDSLDASV